MITPSNFLIFGDNNESFFCDLWFVDFKFKVVALFYCFGIILYSFYRLLNFGNIFLLQVMVKAVKVFCFSE